MTEQGVFNRETLLDMVVNVVPLGIMAFFLVLFAVASPWSGGGVEQPLSMALIIVPFLLLAYLTYLTGKQI